MVKGSEPAQRSKVRERAKAVDRLGRRQADGFNGTVSWSRRLPADSRHLPPHVLQKRNVETSYLSPGGKANRKASRWRCGLGMSEEANAVL